MKNILFIFAVLCSALSAMGQISKGNIYLLGSGSIHQDRSTRTDGSGTDYSYPNYVNANLGLSGAYFLSDNWALGIGGAIFGSKGESSEIFSSRESGYAIATFGRYYIAMNERFYFYGQAAFNYNARSSALYGSTDPTNSKRDGIGFSVNGGFAFFPTQRIGIDIMVGHMGFARSKERITSGFGVGEETIRNEFIFRFNFSTLNLGIQYFLIR